MRVHCAAMLLLAAGATHPAGAADRPVDLLDANRGKPLYVQYCGGCHGERGDGAGPAAAFLDPRPRDFTRGIFKYRTTPTGQPPVTDDVLRTITRGIPGTSMPSFAFLSEAERRDITAHVLRLADLLDAPEPTPIPAPGAPPPATAASVAQGKQLYEDAGCGSCHGPLGKGDGTERLGRFCRWTEAASLPRKWAFCTYFPFLCRPQEEIFVKPQTSQAVLGLLRSDLELGNSAHPETYGRYRALALELRRDLASYAPRDMIDIQSFLWVAVEVLGVTPLCGLSLGRGLALCGSCGL